MAQRKGQTGNPKGRPKGSPNKVTKSLKELVNAFLNKNIIDIQKQYNKLDPKDKLLFFEKLLKYALPTQVNNKIDFESMPEEQLDEVINRLKNGH